MSDKYVHFPLQACVHSIQLLTSWMYSFTDLNSGWSCLQTWETQDTSVVVTKTNVSSGIAFQRLFRGTLTNVCNYGTHTGFAPLERLLVLEECPMSCFIYHTGNVDGGLLPYNSFNFYFKCTLILKILCFVVDLAPETAALGLIRKNWMHFQKQIHLWLHVVMQTFRSTWTM